MKLARTVAVLSAVSLIFAASGGDGQATSISGKASTTPVDESSGTFAPSGTFRMATQFARSSYPTPWGVASFTDMALTHGLIYEGLVYLDDVGGPQPRLATSWEVSEDGLSITFQLRDDVVFSDGTPFDAAAAVANIEYIKTGPAEIVNAAVSGQLSNVESAEATGDYELVLHLVQPGEIETLYWLGRQAGYMASPATFDGDPAGTGPYVVNVDESAADFATIVLDANPDYWEPGAVGFEHIEYTVVPDNTARAAAFNAGQYDAAIGYISMGEPEGGTVDYINASIQMWMITDWQGERVPALANKEVRCAMVEAFNREGIVTSLGEPETNAIYQPFREGQYGYIEDLEVPVFAPEEAQARFEATGEEGFSVVTGVATSDHITNGSLTPWSGVLGQFGITFETETFESSTEYYVRAGQGVDDVLSLPAADLNPLIPLIQRMAPDGAFNPSGAAPEGVAELIASARGKSFEDAEEDISQAWKILIEECIWIPYMVLSGGWWVADGVEGFSTRAMPQGFNILGAHFTD